MKENRNPCIMVTICNEIKGGRAIMRADKYGKYRVNFYLNPDNQKDQKIIEYLKGRYSPNDFLKELLFSLATGSNINTMVVSDSNVNMISVDYDNDEKEEYDPIKNLDDIEL